MSSVAEVLVELLSAAGIDCGFGVPGGQTIPFYAAARARGFNHVLMRDERNAACAADAYARVSGRVGFCDATLGPGATNLISGLAEAYASAVPVLALVADVKTTRGHLRERGVASQALEQRALFQSVVKWHGHVPSPEALKDVFLQALRVATTGRCGPVVLEIPEDVLAAEAGAIDTSGVTARDSLWPRGRSAPDPDDLAAIVEALARAKTPVLLAGGGAVTSQASEVITRLADEHGIAVVTSINGKGAIAETHPCALGPVGVFGATRASRALQRADLVLAVGTKFAQFNSFLFRLPGPTQRVYQIDIDGAEIGRAVRVEGAAIADARTALEQIAGALAKRKISFQHPASDDAPPQPGDVAEDDPGIAPGAVMAALDAAGGEREIFVTDASLSSGWASPRYRVKRAGRGFLAPRGLAGIGWAGGAAIGAALALKGKGRVIALAGDGAAGYWLGEMETAARLKLPITFVILNNAGYGWVVQGERMLGIAPESCFTPVDFSLIAQGLGLASQRVRKGEDISAAVARAMAADGPSLIDFLSSDRAQPSVDWGALDENAKHRYGAYGMG